MGYPLPFLKLVEHFLTIFLKFEGRNRLRGTDNFFTIFCCQISSCITSELKFKISTPKMYELIS